ncbi:hypothetical protein OG589_11830 [Sphaerisporangium sp. NBC_01403]
MGKQRTELRDISDAGAELDESQLQGVSGGRDPQAALSFSGRPQHDDMQC